MKPLGGTELQHNFLDKYVSKDLLNKFQICTSVPGKVGNQINIEIEKTKAYQKKSWAEAKAQWQKLLSKFQAN